MFAVDVWLSYINNFPSDLCAASFVMVCVLILHIGVGGGGACPLRGACGANCLASGSDACSVFEIHSSVPDSREVKKSSDVMLV